MPPESGANANTSGTSRPNDSSSRRPNQSNSTAEHRQQRKRNSRQLASTPAIAVTGTPGRSRQSPPGGAIDLPAIDTRNVRRTNLGGSLSVPQSPTSGALTGQSLGGVFMGRHQSIPQNVGDLTSLQQQQQKQITQAAAGYVKSGRMTKIPHYGRLRSVTARVLRMMDPRTLANQYRQQQQRTEESAATASKNAEEGGTAAGVLGRSFVDTVRGAAASRRRRRYSQGSLPMGVLSRNASRESRVGTPNYSHLLSASLGAPRRSGSFKRKSFDMIARRSQDGSARHNWALSRQSSRASHTTDIHNAPPHASASMAASDAPLSPGHSILSMPLNTELMAGGSSHTGMLQDNGVTPHKLHSAQQTAAAAYESIIAIPMPGFFLDPSSDHWVGGHSFRQRMRYPDEDITVPASLTKRVHYEVSYDYPKNAISTARYNVVTFLPAQLAAQFSKVANVYFLFIAALQQVPGWSTTGRWSTVLPLCIFVSLSIAHEGFDDLRRHRMDHAENTQRTRVLKVKVHDRERVSFNFRELRSRGSHSIHSFRMRSSQSIHDISRNTIESARRWAISAISIGSTIKESVVSRLAEKRRKQRELEDSDDEDEHLAAGDAPNGAMGDDDLGGSDNAAESLLRRRINRGVMSIRSWRSTTNRTGGGGGGGDSQLPTPTTAGTFSEGVSHTNSIDALGGGAGAGAGAADSSGAMFTSSYNLGDPVALSMPPVHRRGLSNAGSGFHYHHQRQASRLGGASIALSSGALLDSPMMTPQQQRRGPTVAFNDVVEEMSFVNADDQIENPLPENMSCRWKKKRWENVQVGDLLMIEKDDWIPADCIVIASTGFDGTCFVETAALDGETTLKQKQALEVTNSEIQTPEQLAAFNAFTYVEPPSPELYNFEGYMEISGKRYPLTPNQLLLRGSVLRNTAYVFAQVVYSGEQTRLRLNATRNVRTKAPQIQRITNRIVILVFALLLILCFVFSALGIHWNNSGRRGHWYLADVHMPATALIFGYIVMMNALIPISLYVTLEAVKIFQCWFIQQDASMYHPDTDTRAEARTTAINEDLGMVRYVFSDKTGTLTENIMKLRAVMVAGFSYLHVDLDRLQQQQQESSRAKEATDPLLGEALASGDQAGGNDNSGFGGTSPRVKRSLSKLSFLRPGTNANGSQPPSQPGTPTGGGSGWQTPLLFKNSVFSKQHRRQHSMPVSMLNNVNGSTPASGSAGSAANSTAGAGGQGSRALQQLALTNRVASGSGGIRAPFARHIRGLSASVLRTSFGGGSGGNNDLSGSYTADYEAAAATASNSDFISSDAEAAAEAADAAAPALTNEKSDPAQLEEAFTNENGAGRETDPDLAQPGSEEDPLMHTKAADDAPVSDLQKLPSSRRIMDSMSPPSEVFRARAEWFLRCIALCHTVQPDRDPLTGRITGYQAISPDEKALVAAAAELGYVMNNRAGPLVQLRVVASERMRDFNKALIDGIVSPTAQVQASQAPLSPSQSESATSSGRKRGQASSGQPSPNGTHVSFADDNRGSGDGDGDDNRGDAENAGQPSTAASAGEDEEPQSFDRGVPEPDPTDRLGNYEVLDVLEFSSARKRMSVIYRCPDGRIVMMSKGADSAIWPRLLKTEKLVSQPGDVSFKPRPAAPERTGWPPLRRKLSNPSAAYLHSRNSSVVSNSFDFVRNGSPVNNGLLGTVPQGPVSDSAMYSPRMFARFGELPQSPRMPSSGLATSSGIEETAAMDERDDDGEDDSPEEDEGQDDEQGDGNVQAHSTAGGMFQLSSAPVSASKAAVGTTPQFDSQLKSSAEAAEAAAANIPLTLPFAGNGPSPTMPSPLRPFRLTHRRLMSDSQFSAISEASSFGDTQGHVEIPDAFGNPSQEEEEWARARALEALHQFSTEGLRTLAYAHKEIEEDVYETWHQRYIAATTALVNRQQQVEAVCEEIEGDLLLSGVSAIEDRLQSGVPETIFKLRRAGIRVWMLTGDKVETAINIAKSCRLIDTDVIETTKLGDDMPLSSDTEQKSEQQEQQAAGEQPRGKDRMTLLILQSMTDYEELDRVLSQALVTARGMTANVDERFERRSRMEKLRRGMKRFGGFFDPRRRKSNIYSNNNINKNGTSGGRIADFQHQMLAGHGMALDGDKDSPIAGTGAATTRAGSWEKTTTAETSLELASTGARAAANDGLLARPSAPAEIEWADETSQASDTTRGNTAVKTGASSGRTSRSPTATEFGSDIAAKTLAGSKTTSSSLAVVIDGETLAALEQFEGEGVLDKFLTLGTLCDAVICSRVSPSQKALIVHNMRMRCEGGAGSDGKKKKLPWWSHLVSLFKHDSDRYMVTLAIGDGGNDIAMIQEAHVGIGIAGQEGLQASRAADFSIGQFRFLQKLLLVHGRWSYVRVSMFIMGTFYKCMAFYITQLIFQFYTGFSGTSLFESWTLSMYNTLFSILPVLVVGIFEQDLRPETLLAYPELYKDMGPSNHLFTVPLFLRRVVVIGILHSIIAAYFPFATNLFLGNDATSNDMYINGFVVYSIMVLIVTFKIAYVDVRRWVVFSHLSVVLTLVVWFGWNGVLNHIYPASPGDGYIVLGTFVRLMKRGNFWFQWIIFTAIAICLNVLIMLVYTVRDPIEHRIMSWVAHERREEHRKNRLRRKAWMSKGGGGLQGWMDRLVGGGAATR
ncbi:hypothetical protein GGI07_004606 [Coemansia sp. Benny D115]|nr:hypothetical protein GGI07_004606 [Coemansia sp. Benny D115]